ncbi:MAG: MBOAT family O-acyltransferase [Bacillota bacterium]
MIFSDPSFLFLVLPLTLLLFYAAVPRLGKTAGMGIVFVASLIIYWPWGERNVTILLASVLVNYTAAITLLSLPPERQGLRKTVLALGLGYDLLSLAWFKYTIFQYFYYRTVGVQATLEAAAIPIGISFYTFQQAAVLADAFNYEPSVRSFLGQLERSTHKLRAFVRYAFFVTFFPHMIIGPIAYVHEIWPQLASKRFGRFRQIDIAVGIMLIGIGLFKKLVIADNLADFSAPVFAGAAQGGSLNVVSAGLGILAYYTQLYFDFSGYSDMALGLARLFGIVFPINFYSPLKSVGIVDFYRRWHMTLTRVISRFLFSPISLFGTRYSMERRLGPIPSKLLRLWLPLVINFEVIGLWHGALWTFALFGAIHGLWYVVEMEVRSSKKWKAWKKKTSAGLRRALGRLIFVGPMALTFALFRSESVAAFFHLVRELFRFDLHVPQSIPPLAAAQWIAAALIIIYALPNSVELLSRYNPGIMTYENESYGFRLKWRPNWRWAAYWTMLVLISLHYIWRQPPFLYMGF